MSGANHSKYLDNDEIIDALNCSDVSSELTDIEMDASIDFGELKMDGGFGDFMDFNIDADTADIGSETQDESSMDMFPDISTNNNQPYTFMVPKIIRIPSCTSFEVFKDMMTRVEAVHAIAMDISPNTIRRFLDKLYWNDGKILNDYCECQNNVERLYKEYNVEMRYGSKMCEYCPPDNSEKTKACLTCKTEFPVQDLLSMYCSHTYCRPCWQNYLIGQIMGMTSTEIKCPGPRCKFILEEEDILKIFRGDSNLEFMGKYYKTMVKTYVACTRGLWICCDKENCFSILKTGSLVDSG